MEAALAKKKHPLKEKIMQEDPEKQENGAEEMFWREMVEQAKFLFESRGGGGHPMGGRWHRYFAKDLLAKVDHANCEDVPAK